MQEQITSAQFEVEGNIELLRRVANAGGDAGLLGQAETQLQTLNRLQNRIAHAGPGAVAALRAEVVALVSATQISGQMAQSAAARSLGTEAALQSASAAAHRAVEDFTRDFYEKKKFDPYLKFASSEDEEAYRKREAEYRREIEKAQAEGTPEGNLRAANLSIAQLKDAGSHGADQSPDYATGLAGLKTARDNLAARVSEQAKASPVPAVAPVPSPREAADDGVALDPELLASLRATGVTVADNTAQGHGVTKQLATAAQSTVRV